MGQRRLLFLLSLTIFTLAFIANRSKVTSSSKDKVLSRAYDGSYNVDGVLKMDDVVPVAIIGSGPAGLSAAIWTARSKYKTLIFAGSKLGGQLTEVKLIENWPGRAKSSGIEVVDDLKDQAKRFGAQIIYDTVTHVDLSTWPFVIETEKGAKLYCLSMIVATGGTPKRLDIKGVKEYWAKGVGTCSICDAPFTKDKKIIVVGGGDSAGDRALQFAAYAKKIIMVMREPELQACGTVQEYLEENPKIKFLFNTDIIEILGDENTVKEVVLKNVKTGEKKKVAIDGVYFAIGYQPNSGVVSKFVETDEKGFIIRKDCCQKTSVEGVFTAGDVDDNPYRKAVMALGSGIEAALNSIDFLQDHGFSPSIAKKLSYPSFVMPDDVEIEHVATMKELNDIIKKEKNPVLIDFHANYCSLCRALLPELELLADEFEDDLKVVKVIWDEDSKEVFEHFAIKSIPYYIIFKDGQEYSRGGAIVTPKELREFVYEHVKEKKLDN